VVLSGVPVPPPGVAAPKGPLPSGLFNLSLLFRFASFLPWNGPRFFFFFLLIIHPLVPLVVDTDALNTLTEMGFPKPRSRKALLLNR
jgi:hypothetical protein